MRIPSTFGPMEPPRGPHEIDPSRRIEAPASPGPGTRYSVLNDFRYLTRDDADLLRAATGERIGQGTDPSSPLAQQLALDRRTGELAPNQQVTAVYLRNASAALEQANAGRRGWRNPYSGPAFDKAVAHLEATGRGRADIRL